MNFGGWIGELRQEKNLRPRELAATLKVTFAYLNKIENLAPAKLTTSQCRIC